MPLILLRTWLISLLLIQGNFPVKAQQLSAQELSDDITLTGSIKMADTVNIAHPTLDSYCLLTKVSIIDRPLIPKGDPEIDKDITLLYTVGLGDIQTGVCTYYLKVPKGLVFGRPNLLLRAEYTGGWSTPKSQVIGIPIDFDHPTDIKLGSGTHLNSMSVNMKLYTLNLNTSRTAALKRGS
ncbi:MAG: hypothetical protein ICV85_09875 [Tolypothrix sp. T3-bin4]|nr:hypothetical protein [Tolypothrix sp. T3-bin4]